MNTLEYSPEISLLLRMLDEAFERKAWHGPNLKGSLRGVTAAQAAWRPATGRHNIWEIVVHAAYWKYAVNRRLTGGKRGSFPQKGSNWFRRPEIESEAAWRADLVILDQIHRAMRATIEKFPPSRLNSRPSGSKVSNLTLIYGIAAHDLYHTGQIQLLKKGVRP